MMYLLYWFTLFALAIYALHREESLMHQLLLAEEAKWEETHSPCCGEEFDPDISLCPQCKEHI